MKKCESKIGMCIRGKESVRERNVRICLFFLQPRRIFDIISTEGYQSDRCVIVKGDRTISEKEEVDVDSFR